MRKFILIAALMIITASAHAGPSTQVASNETPIAQTADAIAEPVPVSQEATKHDVKQDTVKLDTVKQDTLKPVKVATRKHEGSEAKARRIAAKYGVYW